MDLLGLEASKIFAALELVLVFARLETIPFRRLGCLEHLAKGSAEMLLQNLAILKCMDRSAEV